MQRQLHDPLIFARRRLSATDLFTLIGTYILC